MKVLQSPSYLGKSGDRTLFSIQTSSGKQIRSHSYFQHEDEILLPPGTYLRVVGQLNPAHGFHIIQLEEVAPPFELLAPPFTDVPRPAPNPIPYVRPASPIVSHVTTKVLQTKIDKPSTAAKNNFVSGQLFIISFIGRASHRLAYISKYW